MVRSACSGVALLVLGVAMPSQGIAQESNLTHVVREGETLSTLARQYLGDGERWPEIAQANQGRILDPNLIPTGVELRIPDAAFTGSPSDRVTTDPETSLVAAAFGDIEIQPLTMEERILKVEQAPQRSLAARTTVFTDQ